MSGSVLSTDGPLKLKRLGFIGQECKSRVAILLQIIESEKSQVKFSICPTLHDHWLQPTRLSIYRGFSKARVLGEGYIAFSGFLHEMMLKANLKILKRYYPEINKGYRAEIYLDCLTQS